MTLLECIYEKWVVFPLDREGEVRVAKKIETYQKVIQPKCVQMREHFKGNV